MSKIKKAVYEFMVVSWLQRTCLSLVMDDEAPVNVGPDLQGLDLLFDLIRSSDTENNSNRQELPCQLVAGLSLARCFTHDR